MHDLSEYPFTTFAKLAIVENVLKVYYDMMQALQPPQPHSTQLQPPLEPHPPQFPAQSHIPKSLHLQLCRHLQQKHRVSVGLHSHSQYVRVAAGSSSLLFSRWGGVGEDWDVETFPILCP
jgi:hypothetical protein